MLKMKIEQEDYKHIASLIGILAVFAVFFIGSKKGVEHDIAQSDRQIEYCQSEISRKEFDRYNCAEILWQSP